MRHFSLSSWLLVVGAGPVWLFLIAVVPQSPGWGGAPWRFVLAPVVLVGITIALHRLLRGYRNAWSMAALLAGVVAFCSVWLAAWLSS